MFAGVDLLIRHYNTTKLWRVAKFRNEELARKIAKGIIDYAIEQNVDVIVFEHLDMQGKKRGSKKQKLHMWKKNSVQKYVEYKAHRNGIKIRRICAWNTSKLAYDGSGIVTRDSSNYTRFKGSSYKIENS